MAVPKKRRSYTRRHKRRANHALVAVNYAKCAECGEPVLAHRVCAQCGMYKGKRVLIVE